DSPLPGQVGTSVIVGRRAAFGGPLGGISHLRKGQAMQVTTGQGRFTFDIVAIRRAGSPEPPSLASGGGRLTLVTAEGIPFVPNGVVQVDAVLKGTAVVGDAPLFTHQSLPASERPMGSDRSGLLALSVWLEALILIVIGATLAG